MGDLDLPFEKNAPGQELPVDGDTQLSGGVVIMAVVVPLADGSPAAGLLYRFARPDGSGVYPPILLVPLDNRGGISGVGKVAALTAEAAAAALEALL